MDTPRDLKDAGAKAVTEAARAVVRARRAFPYVIDLAHAHGLDDTHIRELCAEEGLSWSDVRALLETENAA